MAFHAGIFRHRVTLQQKADTRDATGAQNLTWTDVASIYADVKPYTRGYEKVQGDRETTNLSHRVRIRARAGITTSMRLKWGERYLLIEGIEEKSPAETHLICREVRPGATT